MGGGMQAFLRAANLYGPPEQKNPLFNDMPDRLPTDNPVTTPPLVNRQSTGQSMAEQYPPHIDETVNVGVEPRIDETVYPQVEPDTLESFRQNVMNPPQRQHMTYPKSTLSGLHKALEIAAEPSPLEKNRVWVDGNAYQKQNVITDAQGQKHYVTNVHEPSFGSQVMRAMPASIEGATDILNQPYADSVEDWKLKNEGLSKAAAAESQMALANQRNTTAANQGRALDIKEMDANTRAYIASLKDLPESVKQRMLQDGRLTIAQYNAAAQYSKQELSGQQAMDRTIQTGKQNKELEDVRARHKGEQIDQQGRIRSSQITQQGNIRSGQIAQQGDITSGQITQRGEQARQTKAAPSGAAGATANIPSQRKIADQDKAVDLVNEHPEWDGMITINEHGFPEISKDIPPETYDAIYNEMYGVPRSGVGSVKPPPAPAPPAMFQGGYTPGPTAPVQQNAPAPQAPAQTAAPIAPQPTSPQQHADPYNVPVPPPLANGPEPIVQFSQSTGQHRISYDGGQTWRPYNPYGKQ